MIPLSHCLSVSIAKLKCDIDISHSLKCTMENQIAKRLKEVEKVKTLAMATILYPRFKKIHFQNPVAAANAISALNTELQNIIDENRYVDRSIYCTTVDNTPSEEKNLWACQNETVKNILELSDTSSIITEFKLYLQQNVTNRKACPHHILE